MNIDGCDLDSYKKTYHHPGSSMNDSRGLLAWCLVRLRSCLPINSKLGPAPWSTAKNGGQ